MIQTKPPKTCVDYACACFCCSQEEWLAEVEEDADLSKDPQEVPSEDSEEMEDVFEDEEGGDDLDEDDESEEKKLAPEDIPRNIIMVGTLGRLNFMQTAP